MFRVGNVRGMDVVNTGADLVRVFEMIENIQKFHVGTGGFNGNDVGVHRRDRRDDVVELRVAHMGVDLGFVLHTVGGDTERFDRPIEVFRPLGAAQGKPFAQGGFVDLKQSPDASALIHPLRRPKLDSFTTTFRFFLGF